MKDSTVFQHDKYSIFYHTSSQSAESMQVLCVTEALVLVGPWGRYQKIVDVILALINFTVSLQTFIMYFCTLKPSWRCHKGATLCKHQGTRDPDDNSRCHLPRDQWDYTEDRRFSVVTYFDVSCDEQWKLSYVCSMHFIGFALGSIVLGWLGDRWGRKFVMFPSFAMLILLGSATAFMPNVQLITACRFFIGFFHPGVMDETIVLISEMVGAEYRLMATMMILLVYPLGFATVGVLGYLLKDWKLLCIVCNAPYSLLLLSYWFIPESVAWLESNGQTREAVNVLRLMAAWNHGEELPDDVMLSSTTPNATPRSRARKQTNVIVSALIQSALWAAMTLIFFGFNFVSDQLPGNLYRNFILMSLVELPTVLLAIPLCDHIGRKPSNLITLSLAGLTCLVVGALPSQQYSNNSKIVLGMVGKFLASFPFQTLYVWSVELFPLRFRSRGIGVTGCVSRVSAACVPLLMTLHATPVLMFTAMGLPAIFASLLGLWLPETDPKRRGDHGDEEVFQLSWLRDTFRYLVGTHRKEYSPVLTADDGSDFDDDDPPNNNNNNNNNNNHRRTDSLVLTTIDASDFSAAPHVREP